MPRRAFINLRAHIPSFAVAAAASSSAAADSASVAAAADSVAAVADAAAAPDAVASSSERSKVVRQEQTRTKLRSSPAPSMLLPNLPSHLEILSKLCHFIDIWYIFAVT